MSIIIWNRLEVYYWKYWDQRKNLKISFQSKLKHLLMCLPALYNFEYSNQPGHTICHVNFAEKRAEDDPYHCNKVQ